MGTRMRSKAWTLYLALILFPPLVHAGEGDGSGFDFLRRETGARLVSMAGAFVAMDGDVHGLFTNPAVLSGVDRMNLGLTYTDVFLDIRSGNLVFCRPVTETGRIGIGIDFIDYGDMSTVDETGQTTGTFWAGDWAVGIAYGQRFPFGLSGGISAKVIQSKIESYSSVGLAVDAGLLFRIESQQMTLGASVQNLGRSVKAFMDTHERMPTAFRLGFSKRLAHLPLLLGFNILRDVYQPSSAFLGLTWALGGEFTLTDHLFLRLGYNSRGQEQKAGWGPDRWAGISLGFGLLFKRYRVDYGFRSQGILGQEILFPVGVDLCRGWPSRNQVFPLEPPLSRGFLLGLWMERD